MDNRKRILLPNLIRLCIDKTEGEGKVGRVYTPTRKEPILFQDWGRMLVEVDYLFDENGYPQSFQKKRSFTEQTEHHSYHYKPESVVDEDWFYEQKGNLMTYNILIKSRQFSTWQGQLLDENNQLLEEFGDALELLSLIFRHTNI